jgi:CopG family nickel-responsive transcriptional regulator
MKEKTVRFSVSLPVSLLKALDGFLRPTGYASRSEFVRDLIREKLVEMSWKEGRREGVGVLTLLYNHAQGNVPAKLLAVQHRHHVHVVCSTHVHLDEGTCLEILVLRGRPQEVQRMALEIGGMKGVEFSQLTRALRPLPTRWNSR